MAEKVAPIVARRMRQTSFLVPTAAEVLACMDQWYPDLSTKKTPRANAAPGAARRAKRPAPGAAAAAKRAKRS